VPGKRLPLRAKTGLALLLLPEMESDRIQI